jgi:hypothetical protein
MNKKKANELGGLLFVACLFIGLGFGFLFHRVSIGASFGMAVGFLLMAYIKFKAKEE